MSKLTYNKIKSDFNSWNLTWHSVSPLKDRLFFVIPSCKMDLFCCKLILTISATNNKACIVRFLNNLFTWFSKTNNCHLFTNYIMTFSRNYVTKKLQERICALGYKRNYTGHSFKKRATILTRLAGLSEDEIQLLGKWNWIIIAFMSKSILTGYTMHFKGINLLKHNSSSSDFCAKQYHHQAHQFLTLFSPVPAPTPNPISYNQVNICRYFIHSYKDLGVRLGMYITLI